jgi:uncharacterized protein (DUF486 family)
MQLDDRFKAAALLFASNTFMTIAWYGHLKFKKAPLIIAIVASWGIAFFEYTLQVPANRIGYRALSAYQLKVMQEAITLVVFCVFARVVLGERITWNYYVGFALVMLGVFFVFHFRAEPSTRVQDHVTAPGDVRTLSAASSSER